ncbi:MAG: cell division protein [Archaeoglobus sp.]|nr:cell division protein [Archaeoglobus sp.]
MRLLSLGLGKKGCRIAGLLGRSGERINDINLFKCYAIHRELPFLSGIELPESNKFTAWLDDDEAARSVINTIFSRNEFFEASLLITELMDDYGFNFALRLGDELMSLSEDPVMVLAILPYLEAGSNYEEIRRRLKLLTDSSHFLILFEDREGLERMVLSSLNMMALVGEIDLKKKIAGEVVIDTSDVFNSLMKKGLSAIGYSSTEIKKSFFDKLAFWREDEPAKRKSDRMLKLMKRAIDENLSARCDLDTAKSVLVLFEGDPEFITMDGMFSCLKLVNQRFSRIELRYGDYPVPGSKVLKTMILFSGMTGFKY